MSPQQEIVEDRLLQYRSGCPGPGQLAPFISGKSSVLFISFTHIQSPYET
jgi:hypothetical protein